MNIWENAVITLKGLSLMSKLTAGNTLEITRAETGEGYVAPGLLSQISAVSSPKQALSMRTQSYPEEGKCQLPCYLTNDGLSQGYTVKQIGVYATDPDEGEILFLIVQAPSDEGTIVPSETEMPGYSAEWTLYFQYGQADGVSISVDPSNSVTYKDLEELDKQIIDVEYTTEGNTASIRHKIEFYDEKGNAVDLSDENAHKKLYSGIYRITVRSAYPEYDDSFSVAFVLQEVLAYNHITKDEQNPKKYLVRQKIIADTASSYRRDVTVNFDGTSVSSGWIDSYTNFEDVREKTSDMSAPEIAGYEEDYYPNVKAVKVFVASSLESKVNISDYAPFAERVSSNIEELQKLLPVYSTEDIVAGETALETGRMYLVYE